MHNLQEKDNTELKRKFRMYLKWIFLLHNYPELFLKFQTHGTSLQGFSKRKAV